MIESKYFNFSFREAFTHLGTCRWCKIHRTQNNNFDLLKLMQTHISILEDISLVSVLETAYFYM